MYLLHLKFFFILFLIVGNFSTFKPLYSHHHLPSESFVQTQTLNYQGSTKILQVSLSNDSILNNFNPSQFPIFFIGILVGYILCTTLIGIGYFLAFNNYFYLYFSLLSIIDIILHYSTIYYPQIIFKNYFTYVLAGIYLIFYLLISFKYFFFKMQNEQKEKLIKKLFYTNLILLTFTLIIFNFSVNPIIPILFITVFVMSNLYIIFLVISGINIYKSQYSLIEIVFFGIIIVCLLIQSTFDLYTLTYLKPLQNHYGTNFFITFLFISFMIYNICKRLFSYKKEKEVAEETATFYIEEAQKETANTEAAEETATFYIEEAQKETADKEAAEETATFYIEETQKETANTEIAEETATFYIEETQKETANTEIAEETATFYAEETQKETANKEAAEETATFYAEEAQKETANKEAAEETATFYAEETQKETANKEAAEETAIFYAEEAQKKDKDK